MLIIFLLSPTRKDSTDTAQILFVIFTKATHRSVHTNRQYGKYFVSNLFFSLVSFKGNGNSTVSKVLCALEMLFKFLTRFEICLGAVNESDFLRICIYVLRTFCVSPVCLVSWYVGSNSKLAVHLPEKSASQSSYG